jgi:hypothetical protein
MFDDSGGSLRVALGCLLAILGAGNPGLLAAGQAIGSSPLVKTGQMSVGGREVPYRIRNLPVSSFPDLPEGVAEALNNRGCLIPQTYEAKRPENVVHGSFERAGSQDWAVLCAAQGKVALLVFFASSPPAQPAVLATVSETDLLQSHDLTGELGFDWGIDPVSPERLHDAEAGMAHRGPLPDHDCLADTTLDRKTVYHLYRNGAWEKIDVE